jgi:hypothetical protein
MQVVRAIMLLAATSCGRVAFDPVTTGDAPPGASARSVLRLDRIDPGETLVDFPIPVVLDDQRARRDLFAGDGANLRFYDANGTVLPHEIEQLGTPGGAALVAWVRVPSIVGTSTTIEVRYGGTPGPAAVAPVWSADYVGVWHLGSEGMARDSTGNGHTAVEGSPGSTTQVPGVQGLARLFREADGDYLVIADTTSIVLSAFTISGWVKIPSAPAADAYYSFFTREDANDPAADDLYLGAYGGNPLVLGTCVTATGEKFSLGPAVPLGTWSYLATTCQPNEVRAFVDGTSPATDPVGGALLSSTANPIFIGADRNGSSPAGVPDTDFIEGAMDEMRLQRVVRSSAWLTYDAAAGRDQVLTYGPVTLD